MTEAKEAFFDTIAEKRKGVFRPAAVSKKRPRKVWLPSDFLDRRKHPSYRSGSVKRYFIDLETGERIDRKEEQDLSVASAVAEMTMDKFRRLPRAGKIEVLKSVYRGRTDKEIAELFGSKDVEKDGAYIGAVRRRNNIHKRTGNYASKRRRPKQTAQTASVVAITPPQVVEETNGAVSGLQLSLSGEYDVSDAIRRLLALAGMIESAGVEGGLSMHVTLQETPAKDEAKASIS